MCPVNEFVGETSDACQPCPAMSSSAGGVVRVCPCTVGYRRVNESDPSLPCVGECVWVHIPSLSNVRIMLHEKNFYKVEN